MTILKIKGNEFEVVFTTNSSSRYATLFRNNIANALKKLGVPSHHIKLKEMIRIRN